MDVTSTYFCSCALSALALVFILVAVFFPLALAERMELVRMMFVEVEESVSWKL